jgi:excisionase family DNA binding protein
MRTIERKEHTMLADWLSLSEACGYSKLSRTYLRYLWEHNQIRVDKIGNFRVVERASLDAWLEKRAQRKKAQGGTPSSLLG